MADVVSYYALNELPFELTPNLKFYYVSENHKNAFDMALFCINKGEALIKITGEVGSGKTMLCRKLIYAIEQQGNIVLYIPNPAKDKATTFKLVSDELGLTVSDEMDEYIISKCITEKLLEHYQNNKRVVLVVDEAQALSDDSIEALRLLTNIESEERKLLQIVLLGQPELDEMLSRKRMRQVLQRIGFSYRITGVTRDELDDYIAKRLISAGHDTGLLFSKAAKKVLFRTSRGTPRLINILAYKALLASYAEDKSEVDKKSMKKAVSDSGDILTTVAKPAKLSAKMKVILFVLASAIGAAIGYYLLY